MARFTDLPQEVRDMIRESLRRQVIDDFRRFRAYGMTRNEARNIYHSIRRMIYQYGRYQRAAIYMRNHGIATIGSLRRYP